MCTNEAFQVFGSRPLFCERTLLIGSSEAFQFVVELFCKCMYEKTFWMFLESVFWRVFTHLSLCTLFPPPPPLPSSPLLPLLISGLFSSSHQANQRKLVEHIVAGSVKKIEKLLEQGLDPNFVTEDGSELQAPPLVGLFTQLLPLRS